MFRSKEASLKKVSTTKPDLDRGCWNVETTNRPLRFRFGKTTATRRQGGLRVDLVCAVAFRSPRDWEDPQQTPPQCHPRARSRGGGRATCRGDPRDPRERRDRLRRLRLAPVAESRSQTVVEQQRSGRRRWSIERNEPADKHNLQRLVGCPSQQTSNRRAASGCALRRAARTRRVHCVVARATRRWCRRSALARRSCLRALHRLAADGAMRRRGRAAVGDQRGAEDARRMWRAEREGEMMVPSPPDCVARPPDVVWCRTAGASSEACGAPRQRPSGVG